MHSVIYQIGTEPISKAEYISPDHIEAGEMASIDYAYDIEPKERQIRIELLLQILPKGMFTLNQDGNFDRWRKSYVLLIQNKAKAITEADVMEWIGPTYQLQKDIVNPLETNALFVTDYDTSYALAERSKEPMTMIERLEKGAQLYIGTIAGYHF